MISTFRGSVSSPRKPFDQAVNYGNRTVWEFMLQITLSFYASSSWDYNYTVGEIAGRRMDCNCGSAECRRRVL